MLKVNRVVKNRPCAFAYIKKQDDETLILMLICAIQNMDKLGTKLLNDVFDYAKNNKFVKILLDYDENNRIFYAKINFKDEGLTSDDLFAYVCLCI